MSNVKYPNVNVKLTDTNGNAFVILGRVNRALKEADVPMEVRSKYQHEATSGDYDHLLTVTQQYVNIT